MSSRDHSVLRAGYLLPKTNRLTNGYRDYGDDDVDRLRFIVRGRDLGFSLEEIRWLLALSVSSELSCTEVDQLARQQLAAVKKRISELQRMARQLERTIDACARQSCGECSIPGALQLSTPVENCTFVAVENCTLYGWVAAARR